MSLQNQQVLQPDPWNELPNKIPHFSHFRQKKKNKNKKIHLTFLAGNIKTRASDIHQKRIFVLKLFFIKSKIIWYNFWYCFWMFILTKNKTNVQSPLGLVYISAGNFLYYCGLLKVFLDQKVANFSFNPLLVAINIGMSMSNWEFILSESVFLVVTKFVRDYNVIMIKINWPTFRRQVWCWSQKTIRPNKMLPKWLMKTSLIYGHYIMYLSLESRNYILLMLCKKKKKKERNHPY